MPALSRRLGVSLVLAAGLVLGAASASVEAAPARPGYDQARLRGPAVKRAWLSRARPAPVKRASVAAKAEKPEPVVAAAAKPAAKERSAAWTSVEGERACFRGRRKLWQGEQGWVVKKVSVCP